MWVYHLSYVFSTTWKWQEDVTFFSIYLWYGPGIKTCERVTLFQLKVCKRCTCTFFVKMVCRRVRCWALGWSLHLWNFPSWNKNRNINRLRATGLSVFTVMCYPHKIKLLLTKYLSHVHITRPSFTLWCTGWARCLFFL